MQKRKLTDQEKIADLRDSLKCYKRCAKELFKRLEEQKRQFQQENRVLKYQVKMLAQMLACHSDPQPGE